MAIIRKLALILMALLGIPAFAQTTIFNCTSFNTTVSAACSVGFQGQTNTNYAFFGPQPGSVSSGILDFVPTGSGHNGNSLWYQTAENVQAFTASVTFVPNSAASAGVANLAFVIQNENNNGNKFTYGGGAGAEAGFSQFSGGSNIYTTNVFAMEFDQWSGLTNSTSFSYSSAQIYQTLQAPFLPGDYLGEGLAFYPTTKFSTSPVPLNSPVGTSSTTTGDTYTALISYDGWNFNVGLWDVTLANGSCSSATSCTGTYFQHSWSGVLIPEIVGATTAVVGLTNGGSGTTSSPLYIYNFAYTVQTPTGTPSYTAYNANSTYNNGTVSSASPVYSVAPGSYAGTQSVSITTSSTPNNYICYTLSSTVPTLFPQPNNNGGCETGTLYSGPVSISSTATLYAMAGSNNSAFSYSLSPTGLGPPSTLVAGTYTIGGTPQAATPTFSPVAGTYTGAQSVTVSSSSSGAIICYNTTGSPATNGTTGCTTGSLYSGPVSVSSNETLYAVAGGTGYSDSTVGSAAYVITPPTASTPSFSPVAGTYTGSQTVTISTLSSGANIYYNTTGSPTCSSTLYSAPVTVASSKTLYAVACSGSTTYTTSSVGSAAYTIKATTPSFSPVAGTYATAQSVTITATLGSVICYNTTGSPATNGTTGCSAGTLYTGPVAVSSTETLYAIAGGTGISDGSVNSALYTINPATTTNTSTTGKSAIQGKMVIQ